MGFVLVHYLHRVNAIFDVYSNEQVQRQKRRQKKNVWRGGGMGGADVPVRPQFSAFLAAMICETVTWLVLG